MGLYNCIGVFDTLDQVKEYLNMLTYEASEIAFKAEIKRRKEQREKEEEADD